MTSLLSEQTTTNISLIQTTGARGFSQTDGSFHSALLKQALLRQQVQSAIYELVLGYEAATGFSVVRLDLQSEKHTVLIDALPAGK
jgi:hypothetical protein